MKKLTPAFVLALAVALGACGQPRVPQDHFYRLTNTLPERTFETAPLQGALVVDRFVADGLISERPLVYELRGGSELRQYHYHYWTDSPTRMLQELMVSYLRAVNVAEQVTTHEVRVKPAYILSGKIRRLEQIRGGPTRVVAELEFRLKAGRGGKLVWLKDYVAEEVASDDSVASTVNAFNVALSRIYQELVTDITRS